ncbi:Z-ring formation inhibitor MciZ [Guptibacillus hwajinpoensis]|uniref:Z-ring formation inhibitor MciZ n=1 Tax=Guptibacillus hwajinpoensis TaxID=208199 RepID=UPI001CD49AA3|nr:Z-ring formation inhibitor MciZ [Pseudalkalibacillus hwajinpoensis]MCA0990868.1 Z-ring formation inhibitor MciZ [Pseudalkalibacillus hwajinpoensis]
MKVYIQPNGITMVGKPKQIQLMIRHYMNHYDTIEEWIHAPAVRTKSHLRLIQ